jgi:hypothetical protein
MGFDVEGRRATEAARMQSQHGLSRMPYTGPASAEELPGLEVDALPADMLVRLVAKKPLAINVTQALINTALDSYAMWLKVAADAAGHADQGAQGSDQRDRSGTARGGFVYMRNASEVPFFWAEAEELLREQAASASRRRLLRERGKTRSTRYLEQQRGRTGVFPSAALLGEWAAQLEDAALASRAVLCGPLWAGMRCAGTALVYYARKDAWFRSYVALFGDTLFVWDTEPTPMLSAADEQAERGSGGGGGAGGGGARPAPGWVKRTCMRELSLRAPGVAVRTQLSNIYSRPPSAYTFEVQRHIGQAVAALPVRLSRSASRPDGAAGPGLAEPAPEPLIGTSVVGLRAAAPLIPVPELSFCPTSLADYTLWYAAFSSLGLLRVAPTGTGAHVQVGGPPTGERNSTDAAAAIRLTQPASRPAAGTGRGADSYAAAAGAADSSEFVAVVGPAALPELNVEGARRVGAAIGGARAAMSSAAQLARMMRAQLGPGSESADTDDESAAEDAGRGERVEPMVADGKRRPRTSSGGTGTDSGRRGRSLSRLPPGVHAVRPDGTVRTPASAASQEGSAAGRTIARLHYDVLLRQAMLRDPGARCNLDMPPALEVFSGPRRPMVKIAVEGEAISVDSGGMERGSEAGGRRRVYDVPVDKVAVHFLPGANPFAVHDPLQLVGTAMAEVSGHSSGGQSQQDRRKQLQGVTTAAHRLGQGIAADVRYVDGLKSLLLRSTVAVTNMLSLPLLVQFEDLTGRVLARRRLGPGQLCYAPLQAAASGRVRTAPMIPGYDRLVGASPDAAMSYVRRQQRQSGQAQSTLTGSGHEQQQQRDEPEGEGGAVEYGGDNKSPLPLDPALPLHMLTPYALSDAISLVDASADLRYGRQGKNLLNTILTGPDRLRPTTLGTATPLVCHGHEEGGGSEPVPVSLVPADRPQVVRPAPEDVADAPAAASGTAVWHEPSPVLPAAAPPSPSPMTAGLSAVLPVFHCAAHIVRPAAHEFRRKRRGGLLPFMKDGKRLVAGAVTSGAADADALDDGLELRPDERGRITQEQSTVDLGVTTSVTDKFTTNIVLLPCVRLENLLPFPLSFRVQPLLRPSGTGGGGTSSGGGHPGMVPTLLPPLMEGVLLPAEIQEVLFSFPRARRRQLAPASSAAAQTTGSAETGREREQEAAEDRSMGPLVVAVRVEAEGYRPLGWTAVDDIETEAAARARGHRAKRGEVPGSRIYGLGPEEEARRGKGGLLRLEAKPEEAGVAAAAETSATEPGASVEEGGGSSGAANRRSGAKPQALVAPLLLKLERVFVGAANGTRTSSGTAPESSLLARLGQDEDEDEGGGASAAPDPDELELIQAHLRAVAVHVRLWVPFWFINRSDLPLVYGTRKRHTLLAGNAASRRLLALPGSTSAAAFAGGTGERLGPELAAQQGASFGQTAAVQPAQAPGENAAGTGDAAGRGRTGRESAGGNDSSETGAGSTDVEQQGAGVDEARDGEGGDTDRTAPEVNVELFSFTADEEEDEHAVCIKDPDPASVWSEPVSVSAVGTNNTAVIVRGGPLHQLDAYRFRTPDGRDNEEWALLNRVAAKAQQKVTAEVVVGVHIDLAPGKFSRTRVVTFTPRYELVNQTGLDVLWRQTGSDDVRAPLPPIMALPFLRDAPGHRRAVSGGEGAQAGGGVEGILAALRHSLNNTAGCTPDMSWMPVQWPVRAGPKTVQLRIAGPGKHAGALRHMGDLALTGSGTGVTAVLSDRDLGARAAGMAASLRDAVWDWTAPMELRDGDYSVKVRRRLEGPHLPSVSVLPPAEARTGGEDDDGTSGSAGRGGGGHRRQGVNPDQVTWLRAGVITRGGTTFMSLSPHPALVPPHQRTAAYRIDNHTVRYRVLVRQRGMGPAAVETVPCYGAYDVAPHPLAMDRPNARDKELLIQVRPVGLPRLMYMQYGAVGRAATERDWVASAEALYMSALGGEEGGVGVRQRGNDSWGVWGDSDGSAVIPCDDVGTTVRLVVGGARANAGRAVRRRILYVRVYADATTGPTKVIHISELPPEQEEAGASRGAVSKGRGSGTGAQGPALDVLIAQLKNVRLAEAAAHRLLQGLAQVEERVAALNAGAGVAQPPGTGVAAPSAPPPVVLVESKGAPGMAVAGTAGGQVVPADGTLALANAPPQQAPGQSGTGGGGGGAVGMVGGLLRTVGDTALGAATGVGRFAASAGMTVAGTVGGTVTGAAKYLTGAAAHHEPVLGHALWVQIVSAVGLPVADVTGASDPFCEVQLQLVPAEADVASLNATVVFEATFATPVCRATLDPVWAHEHTFTLAQHATVAQELARGGRLRLLLRVFDYDLHSRNDLLGCVVVPLDAAVAPEDAMLDSWYPLQYVEGAGKRPSGSVRVRALRSHNLEAARVRQARALIADAQAETSALKQRLLSKLRRTIVDHARSKGGLIHGAEESESGAAGAAHVAGAGGGAGPQAASTSGGAAGVRAAPPAAMGASDTWLEARNAEQLAVATGLSAATIATVRALLQEYEPGPSAMARRTTSASSSRPEAELSAVPASSAGSQAGDGERRPAADGRATTEAVATTSMAADQAAERRAMQRAGAGTGAPAPASGTAAAPTTVLTHDPTVTLQKEREQKGEDLGLASLGTHIGAAVAQLTETLGTDPVTGLPKAQAPSSGANAGAAVAGDGSRSGSGGSAPSSSAAGTGESVGGSKAPSAADRTGSERNVRGRVVGHQLEMVVVEAENVGPLALAALQQRLARINATLPAVGEDGQPRARTGSRRGTADAVGDAAVRNTLAAGRGGNGHEARAKKPQKRPERQSEDADNSVVPLTSDVYAVVRAGPVVRRTAPAAPGVEVTFHGSRFGLQCRVAEGTPVFRPQPEPTAGRGGGISPTAMTEGGEGTVTDVDSTSLDGGGGDMDSQPMDSGGPEAGAAGLGPETDTEAVATAAAPAEEMSTNAATGAAADEYHRQIGGGGAASRFPRDPTAWTAAQVRDFAELGRTQPNSAELCAVRVAGVQPQDLYAALPRASWHLAPALASGTLVVTHVDGQPLAGLPFEEALQHISAAAASGRPSTLRFACAPTLPSGPTFAAASGSNMPTASAAGPLSASWQQVMDFGDKVPPPRPFTPGWDMRAQSQVMAPGALGAVDAVAGAGGIGAGTTDDTARALQAAAGHVAAAQLQPVLVQAGTSGVHEGSGQPLAEMGAADAVGDTPATGGSQVDASGTSVVLQAAAAPTGAPTGGTIAPETSRQNRVPNYLSVSLFVRADDAADEFPIAGGTLVGAGSGAGGGPWDSTAGGERKATAIAALTGAVQAGLSAGVGAGKIIRSGVGYGIKGARTVVRTAVGGGRTAARDVYDAEAELRGRETSAINVPINYFLPPAQQGEKGADERAGLVRTGAIDVTSVADVAGRLPSGAVSRADALVAHAEFIPVPAQGDVVDTWVTLQPLPGYETACWRPSRSDIVAAPQRPAGPEGAVPAAPVQLVMAAGPAPAGTGLALTGPSTAPLQAPAAAPVEPQPPTEPTAAAGVPTVCLACCAPLFGRRGGRRGRRHADHDSGAAGAAVYPTAGFPTEAAQPLLVPSDQSQMILADSATAPPAVQQHGLIDGGAAPTTWTAAPPRVRVKMQWVPLYAAREALRSLRVQLALNGVGVSVVDHEPKELLYVHLTQIHADLSLFHAGRTVFDLGMHRLQINNQMPGAAHPVVVGPAASAVTQEQGEEGQGAGRGKRGKRGRKGGGQPAPGSDAARERAEAEAGLTSADRPVHEASAEEAKRQRGAGAADVGDTVAVHVVLENHPSVIFISDLTARILHLTVNVDDSLFLELLRFIANLHLSGLSESSAEDDVQVLLQQSDDLEEATRQAQAAAEITAQEAGGSGIAHGGQQKIDFFGAGHSLIMRHTRRGEPKGLSAPRTLPATAAQRSPAGAGSGGSAQFLAPAVLMQGGVPEQAAPVVLNVPVAGGGPGETAPVVLTMPAAGGNGGGGGHAPVRLVRHEEADMTSTGLSRERGEPVLPTETPFTAWREMEEGVGGGASGGFGLHPDICAAIEGLGTYGRLRGTAARNSLLSKTSMRRWSTPVAREQLQTALKVYLRQLRLLPISLDITFKMGDSKLLGDLIPDVALLSFLKVGIEAAGTMLANIDHAPVELGALVAAHVFESTDMLANRLVMHYVQEVLFQVYRIIGSASFLGNPVGLVSGVGRDVFSLISAPGAGLSESPAEAGALLASSAVNLVQNTTVGVVDSASKILDSASKGIKAIHMVGERGGGRRPPVRQPPSQPAEGLAQGARTFGTSVVESFRGVVTDPIQGARTGGALGALKGVGSGVLGVLTKPTAGALDGIVLLLQSVSAAANPLNAAALRGRLPRFMGPDGRLLPFSSREAEGAARLWLLAVNNPAAAARQQYVFHCDVHAYAALRAEQMLRPEDLAEAVQGVAIARRRKRRPGGRRAGERRG